MHEASIALSLLDIVEENCKNHGCTRVEWIRARIGKASGVMPEALLFAFDLSKADTVAAGAELRIEAVPVGGHCSGCGKDFEVQDAYVFACPHCGSTEFEIRNGYEMEIVEMEVHE